MCQGGMVGQPGHSDVGLPHVFTLRSTRVHRRAVFSLPSPTVSLVLLRAEGALAYSCSLPPPLSPTSSLLPTALLHLGERRAYRVARAPLFLLIYKLASLNCFSLEAPRTRVPKSYSLSRGSQTPVLGVLPRHRTRIADSDINPS